MSKSSEVSIYSTMPLSFSLTLSFVLFIIKQMMNIWSNNSTLFEDYQKLLKSQQIDTITTEILNRFDQIHAGGLKATEKLSSMAKLTGKEQVLELGGGIGGVARFLVDRFNVSVVNLDLSREYCLTGKRFSELCKIDKTKLFFVNGNAIFCPLKSNIFDIVWLQHVNMNISDKNSLISEISRVLKYKGKIVFHEWFLSDEIFKITLPLPWADEKSESHLCSFATFTKILNSFDFKVTHLEDDSENSINFYNKLLQTKAFLNPIFKNRDASEIFKNAVTTLSEKNVQVLLGVAVKQNL